jgi:hypothetical protein
MAEGEFEGESKPSADWVSALTPEKTNRRPAARTISSWSAIAAGSAVLALKRFKNVVKELF